MNGYAAQKAERFKFFPNTLLWLMEDFRSWQYEGRLEHERGILPPVIKEAK